MDPRELTAINAATVIPSPVIQLADGKTVAEIAALDMDEFFERLQLGEHLSPNRHVGVYAIVDLMKQQAAAVARPLPRAAQG